MLCDQLRGFLSNTSGRIKVKAVFADDTLQNLVSIAGMKQFIHVDIGLYGMENRVCKNIAFNQGTKINFV